MIDVFVAFCFTIGYLEQLLGTATEWNCSGGSLRVDHQYMNRVTTSYSKLAII